MRRWCQLLGMFSGLLRLNRTPEGRIFQLSRCLEAGRKYQLEGHFSQAMPISTSWRDATVSFSTKPAYLLFPPGHCRMYSIPSQGAQHVTDTGARTPKFLNLTLLLSNGCGSQTLNKAECRRTDAFELWTRVWSRGCRAPRAELGKQGLGKPFARVAEKGGCLA